MATNCFGNKHFMQQMRRLRGVFVFLGDGPGVSFVFLFVLNVFPLSSKVVPSGSQRVPQVPNVFPKTFPIAFHFLSHIIWPCFNSDVYNLFGGVGVRGGGKVGAKVRHDKACFYFDEGSWLLCWGVPHFQKYWWWANQMGLLGVGGSLWVQPLTNL
jgi:hypothetical protein